MPTRRFSAILATALAVVVVIVVIVLVQDYFAGRSTPSKDDPAAYSQALVEEAILRYDRDGLQAAVDHYNNPENVDGEWYVFIVDAHGHAIAHHNPDLRNGDTSLWVDAAGYSYGNDLREATEEGRWVDHVMVDPETGRNGQKHTWVVRHDGLLFASGWYEDR